MTLLRRYPAERDGEEAYVLRDHLTLAERRQNVERLRREGKIGLAQALEHETNDLISRGAL
jgi:hypothetical protein